MFGGAAGAESTEQPSSVGGYTIVGELATGGSRLTTGATPKLCSISAAAC